MTIIRLKGNVNPNGELLIQLPTDIPAGEVIVQIEYGQAENAPTWSEEEWHEIQAQIAGSFPLSDGAAIVEALAEIDLSDWISIEDSETWLEAQKQKRQEKNQW